MTLLRLMLGLLLGLKIVSASIPAAFGHLIASSRTCVYDRPAFGSGTATMRTRTGSPVRILLVPGRASDGDAGFLVEVAVAGSPGEFTGKERDVETGLDYFDSRYFGAAQGRFTSPDVLMGKPEWLVDPQRWNRYAYVRNNPLKYIDPNGEDLVIYYSLGSDVSQADREWFEKNKEAILAAIRAKYEKAGVKNVSTRPASELNDRQIAALDKGSPFGVSRLEFAGKEYPGLGSAPKQGVLGYAHPDGKGIAAVFLDTFPRNAPAGCDWSCMAANVGAHEVGHTLGMPHLGFFEELADRWRQRPASLGGTDGSPDLMTGSMGTPTQPLGFKPGTNDRTRKAVEQLNRIGDMTPKR